MRTLAEARTELKARGFRHVPDARLTAFLEDASQEINNLHPWRWLSTTTSGTAPLTITNLREVLWVTNATRRQPLRGVDERHLIDMYGELTTTGTPEWFYLDGLDTLKVYPANTSDTISVRYVKEAAALSADGDTPVFPDPFEGIWLGLAQVRAYAEDSDETAAGANLQALLDRRLLTLAPNYLDPIIANPDFIARTGSHFDE